MYGSRGWRLRNIGQVRFRLRGSAEQKPGSCQSKEEVGRPGGKEGGQPADVTHGLEESRNDEIGDGDADGNGDAGERTALAHGNSERNGKDGHDQGDERIGNFVIQLHAERNGIESALAEVVNVGGEFAETHL